LIRRRGKSHKVTYKGKTLTVALDNYIRKEVEVSLKGNIVIVDSMMCLYASHFDQLLPDIARKSFRVGVHIVRDFETHPLNEEDAERWGVSLETQIQITGFKDEPFNILMPFPANVTSHLTDWTLCGTASTLSNSHVLEQRHRKFNPHAAVSVSWDMADEALLVLKTWFPWLVGAVDRKFLSHEVKPSVEDVDLVPHLLSERSTSPNYNDGCKKKNNKESRSHNFNNNKIYRLNFNGNRNCY